MEAAGEGNAALSLELIGKGANVSWKPLSKEENPYGECSHHERGSLKN